MTTSCTVALALLVGAIGCGCLACTGPNAYVASPCVHHVARAPRCLNTCSGIINKGGLRSAPTSAQPGSRGPLLLRASGRSGTDGPCASGRETMERAAAKVQVWLEDVYESVDYEAALIRAGVIDPNTVLHVEDGSSPLEDLEAVLDSSYLPMEHDMTIDHLDSSSSGGVCEGKEGELTYGEMDLVFFLEILKYIGPPNGRKFVDVGCGRGQLVITAALVGGWGRCEGIEIMADVIEIGNGALEVVGGPSCPTLPRIGKSGSDGFNHVRLHQGDMYLDTQPLSDADVVFAYATCFATEDGEVLSRLSKVFAASIKSGATIITINKRLQEADGFVLLDILQVAYMTLEIVAMMISRSLALRPLRVSPYLRRLCHHRQRIPWLPFRATSMRKCVPCSICVLCAQTYLHCESSHRDGVMLPAPMLARERSRVAREHTHSRVPPCRAGTRTVLHTMPRPMSGACHET